MAYLREFENNGLIKKQVKRKIPFYSGERDSSKFISYKKLSIVFELNNAGLVDYLWENLSPRVIILYGSFAKGESIESSDIDIFVLCKETSIKLDNFEKKLNRKIHLISKKSLK